MFRAPGQLPLYFSATLLFVCLLAIGVGVLASSRTVEQKKEPARPSLFRTFGHVTLEPNLFLDGAGTNIDSPEFFEGENSEEILLLVSGKGNEVIEKWAFPFRLGHQPEIFERESLPNGLAVDQEMRELFIGDADKKYVEVWGLPNLEPKRRIGENTIGSGETNVDVLTRPDSEKWLYATESDAVHVFRARTGEHLHTFTPKTEGIEEVLADSYHQIVYVPEEQGKSSDVHPGGAILAFHPDGRPYERDGTNLFARGLFSGDGEGMALYRCFSPDRRDTGEGFIIAVDQNEEKNGFEFFDRKTWKHLGTLALKGVNYTDGIDVTENVLPDYPQGIFAAVNADQSVALVSWERIAGATGLSCPK